MNFLKLESKWQEIRQEGLTQVMEAPLLDLKRDSGLDLLLPLNKYGWVRGWTDDYNWINFGLIYNYQYVHKNCEACPILFNFLQEIVNLDKVFMLGFSLLKAGTEIPLHVDDDMSVQDFETFHLTLSAPSAGCELQVVDQILPHKEGQILQFKDIYPHCARNKSTQDRLILYGKIKIT